jgi:hypothetical protein
MLVDKDECAATCAAMGWNRACNELFVYLTNYSCFAEILRSELLREIICARIIEKIATKAVSSSVMFGPGGVVVSLILSIVDYTRRCLFDSGYGLLRIAKCIISL